MPDETILYSIQLYDAPVPKMLAPVTSDPAPGTAGAAVVLAGALLDGAPVVAGAAGAAGLELVQPAIETAITTKIIAITLTCENFIKYPPCFNYIPYNHSLSSGIGDVGSGITIYRTLLKNS
jgi:hypothetical protein